MDTSIPYFTFDEPSSPVIIPETYQLEINQEVDFYEPSSLLVIKEEELTELEPLDPPAEIFEPSTNYACLLCKVNFGSLRFVCNHVDQKHKITYKCMVQDCCQSLNSIAKYKIHMVEVHATQNLDDLILKILKAAQVVIESSLLINCLLCSEKAVIGQIQEHVVQNHPFFCRVCGIDFKNSIKFKRHQKQHRIYLVKFYNCSECRVEFKYLDLLKTHFTLMHPGKNNRFISHNRVVKKFSEVLLPFDCPFCETQVFSKDFQAHISSHTVSLCKECSCASVDLNSASKLCVVCSDYVQAEPKQQKITENCDPNPLKVATTLLTSVNNCSSVSHCRDCQTPKQDPHSLCSVCKPRTTRMSLSLSEFSECERCCVECKARLWRFKYIEICINCLPKDVASLDINLEILPQPLTKPEKPRENAKLSKNTITSQSTIIADDDPIEPYDVFVSESPEVNPEPMDFDDTSSEPPWIETAPDAGWISEPVPESPRSTPCDYCEEMCYDRMDLRQHMSISHPEFKKMICAWCYHRSPSRLTFYRHRMNHRSDLGYLCHICGETWDNATGLKRHTLIKHTSTTQKHICTTCNKSYSNELNLKSHIFNSHSEKRFRCENCPKKFLFKSDIESHMQTHTGVYRYRCKLCKAKFTRKDNLSQHVKCNHNFACPICGLSLRTAAEVRSHREEAHTREELEASQVRGEGEFVRFTPFQCGVCFRFLASKQSLDKHLTTHLQPNKKSSKSNKSAESEVVSNEGVVEQVNCENVSNLKRGKRKSNQILPPVTGRPRRSVISNKRYDEDYV